MLATSFPGAEIIGLDSSPDMIQQAKASCVSASWVMADVETWRPETTFDLLFSNALLQWVPDQSALLATVAQWLAPGGVIAIQVPGNNTGSLHKALLATAASARWQGAFSGRCDHLYYRDPDYYFDAAEEHCDEVDVWETTCWHLLKDHQAIIDWYAGTGMRPWLDCLSDGERSDSKNDVLVRAAPNYPLRSDTASFPADVGHPLKPAALSQLMPNL